MSIASNERLIAEYNRSIEALNKREYRLHSNGYDTSDDTIARLNIWTEELEATNAEIRSGYPEG